MADTKKYYYLKLMENFFQSAEIKVLESFDDGIYFSNLYIKLCLLSVEHEGRLRLNEHMPYNEKMISTITGLDMDKVTRGLEALASLNLIERLADGTIFIWDIQSFIGKSSSEADRKRLYREKIQEEKQKQEKEEKCAFERSENCEQNNSANCEGNIEKDYMTHNGTNHEINSGTCIGTNNGEDSGTMSQKRPPEIKKEIEYRDKDRERNRKGDVDIVTNTDIYSETAAGKCKVSNKAECKELSSKNKDEAAQQSITLLKDFEKETGLAGSLNYVALKRLVEDHGAENVKKAIDTALKRNKPNMFYISGILKNWAVQGYPEEGIENGNGGIRKDTWQSAGEFAGFKPKEPRAVSEEERKQLESALL